MRRGLAAAALALLVGCASAGGRAASAAGAPMRGVAGDTVRVVINHVLVDRRAQFERFLHEALLPAMQKVAPSDPVTARQLARARLLTPTAMDRDSTWAYVFLVDPVASSGSYSFSKLFTEAYGSDRAAEYMALFRESLARPQDTYLVVNTAW